jgi:hypothetical protein
MIAGGFYSGFHIVPVVVCALLAVLVLLLEK